MSRSPSLIALAAFLAFNIVALPDAQAAVANWQKGATVDPSWAGDFGTGEFAKSLQQLAADHADSVSLVVPYYQSNITSTDIGPGWNTPTDAALIKGIDAAHALGLNVMLNIHVDPRDGNWRALINPSDRNAWFAAYGQILNHYADLAQLHHVEELCIGTELIKMASPLSDAGNTDAWKALIAGVRGRFSGKVTYSANHGGINGIDEKSTIGFWNDLDSIGLSAYHPLDVHGSGSIAALKADWSQWDTAEIHPLTVTAHKPVLFVEAGYRSITAAHKDPSNWSMGGCYDGAEQARDYEALFSAWGGESSMAGSFLWDWKSKPGAGGAGDTAFTPQGKPAEQVMAHWYGGGGDLPENDPLFTTNPPDAARVCMAGYAGGSSSSGGSSSLSASVVSGSSSSSNSSSSSSSGTPGGGGGSGGSGGGAAGSSSSSSSGTVGAAFGTATGGGGGGGSGGGSGGGPGGGGSGGGPGGGGSGSPSTPGGGGSTPGGAGSPSGPGTREAMPSPVIPGLPNTGEGGMAG